MKRGYRETWAPPLGESPSMADKGENVIWGQSEGGPDNIDDLLVAIGYKIQSLGIDDVSQKLEQLEMALTQDDVTPGAVDGGSVHYNPADVTNWIEDLLAELDSPTDPDPTPPCDASGHDLRAMPGMAAYPTGNTEQEGQCKRMRLGPNRHVLLADSLEAGVGLVHALSACAEAIQHGNMQLADALVKRVGILTTLQTGAMRKVATFFAEALARRIYRIFPGDTVSGGSYFDEVLQMHFYESCPYLKFAHFTANQVILEALGDAREVHVVDLGLRHGMQWPALMQALALRDGGPPSFRLTGVGPPRSGNSDGVYQIGWKLAQYAHNIGVKFDFRGLDVNSLSDLEPEMFETRPGSETLVVNSVFEFHPLLARPGSIEKVLTTMKKLQPEIMTVVEQEAKHNGVVFIERFSEALYYYASMFDALESSIQSQARVLSELYLGRQIVNVVSTEGGDRVERHESLTQWRDRMGSVGFNLVHLGSNAFKQASMLLAIFSGGGNGFTVEEREGSVMLGWHMRPLITTSAWKL